MTAFQLTIKRLFDLLLALLLLPFLILPILILVLIACVDTRAIGLFLHKRIGQHGKPFNMMKIRSLKVEHHELGRLQLSATRFGKWLRRTKLDELPQLFNVILGDMSFVGPRPDVPGFADELIGDDTITLDVHNTYNEQGVNVDDNYWNLNNDNVVVIGSVDISELGEYILFSLQVP